MPLAFVALVLLFLVFNRGAYRGYFPDDDLDNMGNARGLDLRYATVKLLSPALDTSNFRPAAFFYYIAMTRTAGFDFKKYIAVLHVLHLFNAWLLWCLVRRLGLNAWQSGAGVLFFTLHMAAFDIYWKPMYVFDLMCGTFTLLTLNAYLRGWLIASILSFWLAFKCKEIVVFLPLALAAIEIQWPTAKGPSRWWRLAPFFAISLSFGLQAMLRNPASTGNYHLQITLPAIAKSLLFYSSEWLLIPKLGMGLFLLLFVVNDPRFRLGMLLLLLLSAPMLFLPERLFAAYIYVPLIGLSVALASLLRGRTGLIAAVVFFIAWLPWDHATMRSKRKTALAAANEARAWVETAVPWAKAHPAVDTYIYDGAPVGMNPWGLRGALLNLNAHTVPTIVAADGDLHEAVKSDNLAVLVWDAPHRKLDIIARSPKTPEASYLTISPTTPIWQLGDGWMAREGAYRWSKPVASARLRRPDNAQEFDAVVNVSPAYLEAVHEANLTVLLDGQAVAQQAFNKTGWLVMRWPIPAAPAGPVNVEFRISPVFHPNAADASIEYGLPFGGFGFP
ncbi:MAG: hypothetical protein ABI823_14565, partial [Bryobacteraceae bacterium]